MTQTVIPLTQFRPFFQRQPKTLRLRTDNHEYANDIYLTHDEYIAKQVLETDGEVLLKLVPKLRLGLECSRVSIDTSLGVNINDILVIVSSL